MRVILEDPAGGDGNGDRCGIAAFLVVGKASLGGG
jgi:hypothetical protein